MNDIKIIGWTIKVWRKGKKRAVCIDTSDMPDDVAQGIDDYLYDKYERAVKKK